MQYVYKKIASHLEEHKETFPIFTDDEIRIMAVDESSISIAKARLPRSWMTATITNFLIQFLQLVLLVVIYPPNEVVFQKLRTLPEPTPQVILRFWKEVMDTEDGEEDRNSVMSSGRRSSNSNSQISPAPVIDRELLLEQHLAELKSQLDRCEAEAQDLKEAKEQTDDAYIRLQESYDAVRKESIEKDTQLKKFSAMYKEREHRSVKDLEAKISQLEEVTGRQESQINEYRSKEVEMQRKIRRLNAADERLQNLQDDFDVQKVELEHQTRKANAGEKYKQKVQANQNFEKERDSALKELNDARSRLQEAADFRMDNLKLQQENREISQTLSRSERDNTELRETKQAYLSEIKRLQHDSKSVQDALAHSQDRITDLEERRGGSERHPSVADGLDTEISDAMNNEQQMQVAANVLLWARILMNGRKTRILELEKQVQKLTSDASDKDTELAMLQTQLDSAQKDSADQYEKTLKISQEMSVLRSSLTEVKQGHPIQESVSSPPSVDFEAYDVESTEIFKQMCQQIKAQQKQCAKLEEELSAAKRALEVAKTDRTSSFEKHCMLTDLTIDLFEGELVDKPKLRVVEEIRKQNSLALRQLQTEHDTLRERHNRLNDMFVDLIEERNAAWHDSHELLVQKSEIQAKAEAESQILQESSDILRQAVTSESNSQSEGFETYTSKIEESRARLAKAQKVCQEMTSSDVTFEFVPLSEQPRPPHSPLSSSSSSSSSTRASSLNSSSPSSTSSKRFRSRLPKWKGCGA